MRKFAVVSSYEKKGISLPQRSTKDSAGYDFNSIENITLDPGAKHLFTTGVKAYMGNDEVLSLYIRSSLATKRSLRLVNQTGIIDSDYVDNPENEGHILICFENVGKESVFIKQGEKIAQGIFTKYLVTDDDANTKKTSRVGGFGSTGKQHGQVYRG